jgi:FMN-dependent NADH-azoreductase
VTFRYTENGPVGLLGARPVHLFVARGGVLAAGSDHQTPYVRQFLAFLGMTEVNVVHAEGLALGEAQRDAALAVAGRRIDRLAA